MLLVFEGLAMVCMVALERIGRTTARGQFMSIQNEKTASFVRFQRSSAKLVAGLRAGRVMVVETGNRRHYDLNESRSSHEEQSATRSASSRRERRKKRCVTDDHITILALA